MQKGPEIEVAVTDFQFAMRTTRGVQQPLILPALAPRLTTIEPKGVIYTKRWVVELLLDLAGYISSANLVDSVAIEPAAGEGAFLILMIERLLVSCERLDRNISDCCKSLIAYELDEVSAERARTLAAEVLRKHGVNASTAGDLAKSWVHTSDYLLDSIAVEVDFVVGNPPYIRLEQIPEGTATLYRQFYPAMRGRADLYIAFFEAALRQLKPGGACAFICADRWMRNQYGRLFGNWSHPHLPWMWLSICIRPMLFTMRLTLILPSP